MTTDVAVGQMRQIEFVADEEGDWAFHCHKSHHTMNAMGHDIPTMIGVDHSGLAKKVNKLIPDYMVMGERGMADMTEMEMPIPDNTIPMMTGEGPFGSVEIGWHVQRAQGAPRPEAGRLQGPGLVSSIPQARWRMSTPAPWPSPHASAPRAASPCRACASQQRRPKSRCASPLRMASIEVSLQFSTETIHEIHAIHYFSTLRHGCTGHVGGSLRQRQPCRWPR